MFAKDFVVVLLTVEEDKDDDDDCEDDNPSPQARQEKKENTPVPPPENKVKTHQSLIAVRLQPQANILLALVTALKGAIDKDPTTASTITLITCYGVKIGPYPPVIYSNQQLTLFPGS